MLRRKVVREWPGHQAQMRESFFGKSGLPLCVNMAETPSL